MSDDNKIREVDANLKQEESDILNRIYKQEFLLDILKKVNADQLNVPDRKHLKFSLKVLSIQNYLELPNSETLLGLDKLDPVSFTYSEKKALREYVFHHIRKICEPIVEYTRNMEKEIPPVFQREPLQSELLNLDEKRRILFVEAIDEKKHKCDLLKEYAEIKMGPHEVNELEVLEAEYRLNLIKAEMLESFLIQEFCTRTQHTMKAIKEVERYIDTELEKTEGDVKLCG